MISEKLLPTALAFAALLAFACGSKEKAPAPSAETAAPAAAAPAEAGSVHGVARLADGVDPDTAIKMDADPVCQGLHQEAVHTEKVVADANGNLANVFVYVKSGLAGKKFAAAKEAIVLEQHGCIYKPHVQGVMVGQTVKILNNDDTLHNVHALAKANSEFNQGQPFKGMEITKTFDKVEVMMPFKCDVHPWMSSYMGVLDHPFFATSGAGGHFAIEKLPPGEYEIEAWHEVFGSQTQKVTVAPNQAVEVAFEFKPAA